MKIKSEQQKIEEKQMLIAETAAAIMHDFSNLYNVQNHLETQAKENNFACAITTSKIQDYYGGWIGIYSKVAELAKILKKKIKHNNLGGDNDDFYLLAEKCAEIFFNNYTMPSKDIINKIIEG